VSLYSCASCSCLCVCVWYMWVCVYACDSRRNIVKCSTFVLKVCSYISITFLFHIFRHFMVGCYKMHHVMCLSVRACVFRSLMSSIQWLGSSFADELHGQTLSPICGMQHSIIQPPKTNAVYTHVGVQRVLDFSNLEINSGVVIGSIPIIKIHGYGGVTSKTTTSHPASANRLKKLAIYKAKKKSRKIRAITYHIRSKHAKQRPRIKGRFVKVTTK